MHDYTIETPYCTESDNYLFSDCGSSSWALGLFVVWNIVSMYLFLYVFFSISMLGNGEWKVTRGLLTILSTAISSLVWWSRTFRTFSDSMEKRRQSTGNRCVYSRRPGPNSIRAKRAISDDGTLCHSLG
jgi:hypothetical protein